MRVPTPELPENDAAPLFEARLTPYRSLERRGYLTVMALIGGASFVAGLAFLLLGAWPVVGFFGLDVLLVWLAFRLNFRDARRFEEIIVTEAEVLVRQVSPSGRAREHRFNPYWARLAVDRIPDEGVKKLTLSSHGRSLTIGAFLNPDDRATFADAFSGALAAVRGVRPQPA